MFDSTIIYDPYFQQTSTVVANHFLAPQISFHQRTKSHRPCRGGSSCRSGDATDRVHGELAEDFSARTYETPIVVVPKQRLCNAMYSVDGLYCSIHHSISSFDWLWLKLVGIQPSWAIWLEVSCMSSSNKIHTNPKKKHLPLPKFEQSASFTDKAVISRCFHFHLFSVWVLGYFNTWIMKIMTWSFRPESLTGDPVTSAQRLE